MICIDPVLQTENTHSFLSLTKFFTIIDHILDKTGQISKNKNSIQAMHFECNRLKLEINNKSRIHILNQKFK